MVIRLRLFVCWIFALLVASGTAVRAAGPRTVPETDSLLKVRYRSCKAHVHDAAVLPMCDSLFLYAEAAGDVRMQAVALCLRLDHYYYANDREQIIANVRRVQEFCRANGKERLNYFYYFAWSSRLITYYIKKNKYNVAVFETNKMLAEAQAEGYAQGVADCYRMLANLYLSQNTFQLAYDNFRKQIEVLESNGIDDINLPTQYASMAQCALELHLPDSAAVALRKAEALPARSNYQRFTVCKANVIYHLRRKEFDAAGRYLDRIERLFRDDPSMTIYKRGLSFVQREYYKAVGAYRKALDVALAAQRDSLQDHDDFSINRDLGEIYWLMGDAARSADHYRRYIRMSDSIRNHEVRSATDDFSGMLEISRLQTETKQLQLDLERRRLRNTYLVVLLLAAVVLFGGIGIARLFKLNRRLKVSEAIVTAQNGDLIAAGEQLREAKERAELASRMKSEFIQNMSHEVRTPLNSIVGFSQVLASQFRDDPSTGEYASIIESSSRSLLRLIDDVLDIAFLDRTDELLPTDYVEINGLCRECVAKTLPEVRGRVALIVEPSEINPVVHINAKRVAQVLLHLLHNAAKFTEQGEITLNYTCLPEHRLMRFTVTDTGPGIPPEQQEAVFERFVKLDAFSQGTGLGLPVCRIIAAKLGGTLHVDATYPQGCRMIFEIPYTTD